MEKKTKKDLVKQAGKLLKEGYKNLLATDDGHFFTDPEYAAAHAKKISSEVFKFTGEDLAAPEKVSEPEPGTLTDPVTNPEPGKKDKKGTQTKKK